MSSSAVVKFLYALEKYLREEDSSRFSNSRHSLLEMQSYVASLYAWRVSRTRERAETRRDAVECKNCQGASPIKLSRNWRRSKREQVVSQATLSNVAGSLVFMRIRTARCNGINVCGQTPSECPSVHHPWIFFLSKIRFDLFLSQNEGSHLTYY